MLKKNKTTLIITTVLLLVPMLVGILLWDRLPEQVPTHWGPDGSVDGWSSRAVAVFALPAFLLAMHWFCLLMTAIDPKNRSQSQKPVTLVLWICPLLSLLMCGATYAAALGVPFSMNRIAIPLVGVLFVAVGNYLPKCRPNYTIGIKLPWTLHDAENWEKTHRFAGKTWSISGLLMIAAAFLPSTWTAAVVCVVILLAALIPTVYSYLLYRKSISSNAASEAEQTEE